MTDKLEITITITNHNDGAELDMKFNNENVKSPKMLIMSNAFADLIKGGLETNFNIANDLADFAVKSNQCCCDED
ncbi:Uncharacterised protein [Yersinia pseudotuberculosis]|uniref:hypothetical protein n=1 Tax=Yersinia pseudotuberculosis TaxID=633 RepID=UPI0005E816AE|nr:hypothetical protein [Yersinia pseudotuberculosis]BET62229.1 hypothetical protein YPSE1_16880 [Yersinia pseudotuberculosis]CNK59337.1 Uncharacterised protein [Yersinia pseudotuberculosis]